MIGDTPDDVKAGKSAGAVAWGVLTPEEDAKVTLGLSSINAGISLSMQEAGAVGIMKAGMIQMLDIVVRNYNVCISYVD
jgi:hypothetical protein